MTQPASEASPNWRLHGQPRDAVMTFACDGRLFPGIKEDITMMLFNGFCGGGTVGFFVCAVELLSLQFSATYIRVLFS